MKREAETLLAALWTENDSLLPDGYGDYLACRLYGCTPSQLDQEDADRVALHLAFHGVEEQVRARRSEVRRNKVRRKSR